MDLLPSPEQRQIEDMVEQFFSAELPVDRLRKGRPDRAHWPAMVELGLLALTLPEAVGGTGLGLAEDILLSRAAGRRLVSAAVGGTRIAASLAVSQGNDELAAALGGGTRIAVHGILDPDAPVAVDFHPGDLLLVTTSHGGLELREGASASNEQGDDFGLVSLTNIGEPILQSTDQPLLGSAQLSIAAELAGVAEGVQDLTVAYAKERVQFGQPIGGFQAIKHQCADMAVRSTVAWSQVVFAALTLRDGGTDSALQVASAAHLAAKAALDNASAAIQVHGGIGFTAEAHPHRFLKQAWMLTQLLGTRRDHLETIARSSAPA